jgi:glycosyltransferase involved in cell wall biosynthesis
MPATMAPSASPSVFTALCVGSNAFNQCGRVLRHLAVGLVDQAVPLYLVSDDPRVKSLSLGPVQTVLHGRLRGPLAGRRVRELAESLSTQPPAILHAFSGESYASAMALAEELDAELLLQVTSLADCDTLAKVRPPAETHYIVLSERLARAVVERGVGAERVTLVRPGVHVLKRSTPSSDPEQVPTLLCTAPLDAHGGAIRFLEVVSLIRSRGRSVMAFLLGEGSHENTLRRWVRRHGLSSCVTFSHPSGDITQAMLGADVFIQPSSGDAFTADALSAMGAGMAVVTVPCAACDHFLDGRTALVSSEPTAEFLAEAVERLIAQPDLRARITAEGMDFVRSNHSVSSMAGRTADVYRRLVLNRATFSIGP